MTRERRDVVSGVDKRQREGPPNEPARSNHRDPHTPTMHQDEPSRRPPHRGGHLPNDEHGRAVGSTPTGRVRRFERPPTRSCGITRSWNAPRCEPTLSDCRRSHASGTAAIEPTRAGSIRPADPDRCGAAGHTRRTDDQRHIMHGPQIVLSGRDQGLHPLAPRPGSADGSIERLCRHAHVAAGQVTRSGGRPAPCGAARWRTSPSTRRPTRRARRGCRARSPRHRR